MVSIQIRELLHKLSENSQNGLTEIIDKLELFQLHKFKIRRQSASLYQQVELVLMENILHPCWKIFSIDELMECLFDVELNNFNPCY